MLPLLLVLLLGVIGIVAVRSRKRPPPARELHQAVTATYDTLETSELGKVRTVPGACDDFPFRGTFKGSMWVGARTATGTTSLAHYCTLVVASEYNWDSKAEDVFGFLSCEGYQMCEHWYLKGTQSETGHVCSTQLVCSEPAPDVGRGCHCGPGYSVEINRQADGSFWLVRSPDVEGMRLAHRAE